MNNDLKTLRRLLSTIVRKDDLEPDSSLLSDISMVLSELQSEVSKWQPKPDRDFEMYNSTVLFLASFGPIDRCVSALSSGIPKIVNDDQKVFRLANTVSYAYRRNIREDEREKMREAFQSAILELRGESYLKKLLDRLAERKLSFGSSGSSFDR